MVESGTSEAPTISERTVRIGVYLACAVGVALRLRAYLFDRSLWLDELFLWSTLGEARLARAWEPLGEGQVAGPGFVFLAQLSRLVLGDSESALRALPLVAGVLALPWFATVLRSTTSGLATLLGVWLLALSPHAIYYASDFKPYSLDLLVALALLLATTRCLRESRGPSVGFAVGGLAAVLVSLPAALVVGGCGVALGYEAWHRRDRRALFATIAVAVVWLATFLVMHAVLLSHHHDNPDIRDYWVREGAFPASGAVGAWSYLPLALRNALTNPAGFGDMWGRVTVTTWAALALFVIGVVVGWRRDPRTARLHLAILAIALGCGASGLYPFSGRVLSFLVPVLVIPVCVAVESIARRPGGARWATIVAAALLVEPTIGATRRAVTPLLREEARPVVAALAKRIEPGDVVYLSWWGRFAWRYYAPRFGLEHVPVIEAAWIPVERVSEYRADARSKLPRSDRVWFFITHFYPPEDERGVVLRTLAEAGILEREAIEAPAAAVHRLDLRDA